MRFGEIIFEGNRPTVKPYVNAINLGSFGRAFLFNKLKEEGLSQDDEGLREYLNGWLEWDEEMADDGDREAATDFSQIIDTAADTLTYSNVHLQKLVDNVWQPLSSEDKKVFFDAIYEKLDSVPQVA